MAIRFHVAAAQERAVTVRPSALVEVMASLNVLADPRHHPHHHQWVREMRALPSPLRRELRAYRFTFVRLFPFFVVPGDDAGMLDPAAELDRLESLPVDRLTTALLRPLVSDGPRGPFDPAWRTEPNADQRALAAAARYYGRDAENVARQLAEQPVAGAERFRSTVRAYWEIAFAEEWVQLEPILAAAATGMRREIAAGGLFALLDRLSARLVVEPETRTFGFDAPHEHRIDVTVDNPIILVPSVFAWPHVSLNCDDEWQRGLIVPTPRPGWTVRAPAVPGALAHRLDALGDPSRLELLRLLADRPRSTQELAPLVNLTEQGVSKQLRRLAAAGLVTSRRDGYWVVYELRREALEDAVKELERFLDEPLVPLSRPPRSVGAAGTAARGRRLRRL